MHTLLSRVNDEIDLFFGEPDIDPAPRRQYRGRCPECWQYAGCAPGCPNEEIEPERAEASHV